MRELLQCYAETLAASLCNAVMVFAATGSDAAVRFIERFTGW